MKRTWSNLDDLYTPEPMSGCWLWLRCVNAKGYGLLKWSKQRRIAHRFFFEVHRGAIPRGLMVCHKCDNPSCVNPGHLFLGTAGDNARDMESKRRGRHPRGEQNLGGGKLTEAAVAAILTSHAAGAGRTGLALAFGVGLTMIDNIIGRKNWRHVR